MTIYRIIFIFVPSFYHYQNITSFHRGGDYLDRMKLIRELQTSGFSAECACGCEFNLSDAIIFDGTKPFPEEALEYQEVLLEKIREGHTKLEKRIKLATVRAENTSKSTNIGQNLEKIFPTLKEFKWDLPDARFLGDPIDFIIFRGLSKGKVDSINFVEVKTGKAPLNDHQKSVRDAVKDEKVAYRVFK